MQHIKGNNFEQQLASIDSWIGSIKRRISTKVIGAIPPVPIMSNGLLQPDVNGSVFNAVCPINGTILTLFVAVGKYNAKNVTCTLSLQSPRETVGKSYTVMKPVEMITVEMLASAGDIMGISFVPASGVSDVMIAFLVYPERRAFLENPFTLESFLEMTKAEEKDIASESTQN